ncbi:MAG: mechanosensitive ion channel family protein [Sulfuritalea sp.]|nr:mechanosensitive ion channel family protein [Sulfuritalea sp.]
MRTLGCLLLLTGSLWSMAAEGAALVATSNTRVGSAPADLVVFNRYVTTFRADFLGISPAERAERARGVLQTLAYDTEAKVAVTSIDQGKKITIDGRYIFILIPGDVDPLGQESIDETAAAAAERLKQAVAETQEARSFDNLLWSLAAGAIATLVWLALLWGLARLHRRLVRVVVRLAASKAPSLELGGIVLLDQRHVFPMVRRFVGALRWLLVAIFSYEWLSFMLSRFPYTRPWGERLNGYLIGVVVDILQAIVSAIPGLGVAIAIFFIARSLIGLAEGFLDRLAVGGEPPRWLDAEAMPTTRRLMAMVVWLFALAMAYPYLPGAETEAFKGLSVLLGLMVSLGASSLVGQAAAGLIVTYTRTVRMGEYVRVGEYEGTVTELGIFNTRIRTGTGQELALPNSLITGTVTQNYSRVVQGRGFVVDTKVTIGYDTPWRQVEAMLIEAARRTPGILREPAPHVFQTALSDYYPEYLLVAQATAMKAKPRAETMTELHRNIQDVFNEHGVQIMSPHYMTDPAEAKVVPPQRWYEPPATRDAAGAGTGGPVPPPA